EIRAERYTGAPRSMEVSHNRIRRSCALHYDFRRECDLADPPGDPQRAAPRATRTDPRPHRRRDGAGDDPADGPRHPAAHEQRALSVAVRPGAVGSDDP